MNRDAKLLNLGYVTEDGERRWLPSWAQWLIEFGRSLASFHLEAGLRQQAVLTLPDRRFAAVLVGLGAVIAGLERHEPEVTDRFAGLTPRDSYLTWIDSNRKVRFGQFLGIENGFISYRPREHGGWLGADTKRPLKMSQAFWPAEPTDEFVGPRSIANNPAFVDGVIGSSADRFLSVDAVDVLFIAGQAEIDRELDSECFWSGNEIGSMRDLVRVQGLLGLGQQHRSRLIPARSAPDSVESASESLAIFDGPHGFLRLRDTIGSSVFVVLLDRWNPRSIEAAQAAMIDRNEMRVERDAPLLPSSPAGIELLMWTGEL